jgi:hypothetical protein
MPGGEPTCGTVATLPATALELLRAVADGLEDPAGRLAEALAAQVLESPVVQAALQVQAGGPLAIARAVGLAERVLEAFAAQAPSAGVSQTRGR